MRSARGANPQRVGRSIILFPVTDWPLVATAGTTDRPPTQQTALDALLVGYLPILKRHLTWRFQVTEDEAADWLHDFVLKKVLQRNLVGAADPSRGKFRTFVLRALHNFVVQELRRQNRLKRRSAGGAVALEDVPEQALECHDEDPGRADDVQWARTIMAEAVRRMVDHCDVTGQHQIWKVFEVRLLSPILDEVPPPSYEHLAARFGFESPAQACNAVVTGKRMFGRLLRSVVAGYALNSQSVDEELRELKALLLRP